MLRFHDVQSFDVAGLISVIASGRTASSLVAIAFVAILYKSVFRSEIGLGLPRRLLGFSFFGTSVMIPLL